jgi:hypothetical protein
VHEDLWDTDAEAVEPTWPGPLRECDGCGARKPRAEFGVKDLMIGAEYHALIRCAACRGIRDTKE